MSAFVFQRRLEALSGAEFGLTKRLPLDDSQLIARIIDAYRAAALVKDAAGKSRWSDFFDMNADIHDCLLATNHKYLTRVLHDPGETNLFYGFDNLVAWYIEKRDEAVMQWEAKLVFDNLIRLAEAIGVLRLENPEGYAGDPPSGHVPDDVMYRIEASLGFAIDVPNPYPNANGLKTKRGILTYRDVQAVYQAWRISEILHFFGGRSVVEIGAGLGRTAYYVRKFGVTDYTIVDLPLTSVAQAHFLGISLGEKDISLYEEERTPGSVRIVPPQFFFDNTDQRFDLVVNVDSFTEMDQTFALAYLDQIKNRSPLFLSINHENNEFTVRDLVGPDIVSRSSRTPYWMRRGYVEELFITQNVRNSSVWKL